MASNVTGLVANAQGLTPTEKLTLLIMSEYSNPEGESIYPTQKTIALKTGLRRETINKIMGDLARRGVITQLPERAPKGQYFYKINLETLTPIKFNYSRPSPESEPKPDPEPKEVLDTITPESLENSLKGLETGESVSLDNKGVLATVTQTYLTNKDLKELKDLKDLNNYRQKDLKNYRQAAEKNQSEQPGETKTGDLAKPPNYLEYKTAFEDCSAIAKNYKWGIMQAKDLADLVTEFNANGITTADFITAIEKQDNSGNYENTSCPTSYRKRTYSEREKRLTGRYPNPASAYHPANRANRNIYAIAWKTNTAAVTSAQILDDTENQAWEITEPRIYQPEPKPQVNPALENLTNQAVAAIENATGNPYTLQPLDNATLALWLKLGVTGLDLTEYLEGITCPKYLYLIQTEVLGHIKNRKPQPVLIEAMA